jgi:hypothetical protein
LSALLQKEVEDGGISPVKVCRNSPGISHLLFADDTMMFFRASEDQALRVEHVIGVFERSTGQLINHAKCSILFSNDCPLNIQERVRSTLNVVQEVFEPKYLGLPTPDGCMHKGRFQNLQSKLSKYLIEWGDGLMAQCSREILIKAIAQAIPTYIMSIFKRPMSVYDDLTKLIRNYWWGSESGKWKTHWLSWPKITRSKSHGGLGFHDMRVYNQALLAKQAWILVAFPESLVARVLKAKYYPRGDLLDTVCSSNPSATWSAISFGLELLKRGAIYRVGSGTGIRVWRDNWIPRNSYMKVLTPKGNNRLCRVMELLDDNHRWKVDLVRQVFYPVDAELILNISL